MNPTDIEHRGASVPAFFYGTAWKEERTAALTKLALDAGFRAIDTANQRRHYHEAGVGEAIRAAMESGSVTREDLFLQTKFTFRAGQDHRLPYDPRTRIGEQVRQSFASSLEHLGVASIDSYVLHGPATGYGLIEADWEAWRAMEELQRGGAARLIGVSNVDADQLRALVAEAEIKPSFVQNRCFARTGWDAEVRAICGANDILYQGFSLLTANARELSGPEVKSIAQRHNASIAQVAFGFALQAGMIPLTGTSNAEHMRQDLDAFQIELSPDEMQMIFG